LMVVCQSDIPFCNDGSVSVRHTFSIKDNMSVRHTFL
jgi:hypothetical protein